MNIIYWLIYWRKKVLFLIRYIYKKIVYLICRYDVLILKFFEIVNIDGNVVKENEIRLV